MTTLQLDEKIRNIVDDVVGTEITPFSTTKEIAYVTVRCKGLYGDELRRLLDLVRDSCPYITSKDGVVEITCISRVVTKW